MKKKLLKPEMKTIDIVVKSGLLAGSTGVTSNSTLGNEYNSEDVTYGRRDLPIWL